MSSFADFFAPTSSLAATQRILENMRKPAFVVRYPIRVRPVRRRLSCHKGTAIPLGVEQHIIKRAKKNAK